MTDALTLHASSLFSKAGFNDGDFPDALTDWLLDHAGWSEPETYRAADRDVWDRALERLVREHLLPALAPAVVELEVVGSCHNPVRALTYDGRDVTLCWSRELPSPPPPRVDVSVDVPFTLIAEVLREVMAARGAR